MVKTDFPPMPSEPSASSIHSPQNIIGREKEFELLKDILQKVSQGHGRTLLISGREGVGKTKLLEEFVRIAEQSGATCLEGKVIPTCM